MSSTLSIRPATPDDCLLILELIQALADYEREPDAVVATVDGLREQLFERERPAAEVLIGEVEGQAAGFALFFHNFSTWTGKPGLWLEDLFVRPEFRGSGLGKAMMVELARLAVERNCGRFEWWVLDWNQPSIDFYRRLGAKGMDEWTVQRVDGEALQRLAKGFSGDPVL